MEQILNQIDLMVTEAGWKWIWFTKPCAAAGYKASSINDC